jgi:hypothetical protein
MLGFVTRFGASKGMVVVPNLLGLSGTTADSQIASAGLRTSPLSGSVPTNISSQGGISLSQVPAAGTFVDYETPITIGYGNFIADTISRSGCASYPDSTTTSGGGCDEATKRTLYATTTTARRTTVSVTNNITGVTTISYDYGCTSTTSGGGSALVDGSCGYTIPPVTCTKVTNYTAWTACTAAKTIGSSGTQKRTVSGTNKDCSDFSYSESQTCYIAFCESWGPWSTVPSDTKKEQRGQNCQKSDGTFYQNRESRCKTRTSVTYGGCGSNKKRIETTKVYNQCDGSLISSSTASVPCNAV